MNTATRLAILIVTMLGCALPFGSAHAAPTTENVAMAINHADDTRVSDFAWDVSRQRGDEAVKHLNKAWAEASCERCDATAIAFQIVLVSGSPLDVLPVNQAVSINEQCTDCVGAAHARQFVRVLDERVRFSGEGRSILGDVRDDLRAAQHLPVDQQYSAVETQEARVLHVLDEELVVRSEPGVEPDLLEKRLFQDTDVH